MLKHVHQVVPSNRVKGFLDIKLEEESWCLCLVQFPSQIPHIQKIVMDASLLYERTLSIGDKVVHMRRKPSGHHLGDQLGNRMNETNGAKIHHFLGPLFFWNEGNIGGVEPMDVIGVKVGELVYNRHDIHLDSVPTLLEERAGEAVRSRRPITSVVVNRGFDLFFHRRLAKTGEVAKRSCNCCPIEVFVRGGPLLIIFLK
jgi:hypothetical protein